MWKVEGGRFKGGRFGRIKKLRKSAILFFLNLRETLAEVEGEKLKGERIKVKANLLNPRDLWETLMEVEGGGFKGGRFGRIKKLRKSAILIFLNLRETLVEVEGEKLKAERQSALSVRSAGDK